MTSNDQELDKKNSYKIEISDEIENPYEIYRKKSPVLINIIKAISVITIIISILMFSFLSYKLFKGELQFIEYIVPSILFIFTVISGITLFKLHNLGRILLAGVIFVAIILILIELIKSINGLTIDSISEEMISNIYTKIYIYVGVLVGSVGIIIFILNKKVSRLFP